MALGTATLRSTALCVRSRCTASPASPAGSATLPAGFSADGGAGLPAPGRGSGARAEPPEQLVWASPTWVPGAISPLPPPAPSVLPCPQEKSAPLSPRRSDTGLDTPAWAAAGTRCHGEPGLVVPRAVSEAQTARVQNGPSHCGDRGAGTVNVLGRTDVSMAATHGHGATRSVRSPPRPSGGAATGELRQERRSNQDMARAHL